MNHRSMSTLVLGLLVVLPSVAAAQKMTAEEVLTKHADAIAPADKREGIRSFIAVGEVKVEYITQKNQPAVGRTVLASDGKKMFLGLSLNASDYPQEKIVHNGSKTSIAYIRSGSRSLLGTFLNSSTELISQGIFAGPLTTGWAALGEGRSRFSYSGTKKIDGKDTYALRFDSKGGSDVDITLYFDSKTFHHLRTEYSRTSSASIGRTSDESARQNESRLKVTEDFSDFRETSGMTVPHKYRILYTISGARGTTEVAWTTIFTEFALNPRLDAGSFDTDR